MKKQKFYVVWKGRRTGIFTTWAEAEAQVKGYEGAQHKAFNTRAEAEVAYRAQYKNFVRAKALGWQGRLISSEPPLVPSYCTDAACSGGVGRLEYRAVNTETGQVVFARGPFPEGTSNIGEFLAIVELLMLLAEQRDTAPIYSDSEIAIAWVKAKQCKTQLGPNERNAELFERIWHAQLWLIASAYPNLILKWLTVDWGENPADYGRKG